MDFNLFPDGLFDLLKNVTIAVLRERPADLYEFAAEYFAKLRDARRAENIPLYIVVDDDNLATEPDPGSFRPKTRRQSREGRRGSVSAERYDPEADAEISSRDLLQSYLPPKTEDQRSRLTEAVKDILIFRSLDTDLMKEVIDAMFERKVQPGEHVIKQGDDGDNFYVIETGVFDVFISREVSSSSNGATSPTSSGSFGELALMYNMPRAASVVAVTEGTLWAMDRKSFRRIVLQSAFRKRQMYERLLQSVPMLSSLDNYERMTLADALVSMTFEDGECIIKQGDENANGMYFIESGSARVTIRRKKDEGEEEEACRLIGTGSYFGEMALLDKTPRTASVYADGKVKVAFLERDSFERLLGPCLDVMKRNTAGYKKSGSLNH
ncbi:hypothetical protein HELRODRAFT_108583 [Helobdella robusta]|uniref:Cyclic nucleotide-binding domain-containing protein n=1 Tax=Helobdella robusta TaxID=6412 RepID=T1EEK6_HELRO|nr:hypothetical protein HELRODRAFT_108583 [Helobdella robusta]ESN90385.1 hypothetical protein HELRODRAFT_108583 [Helobdella robusta]